jgi:hypothetical protein
MAIEGDSTPEPVPTCKARTPTRYDISLRSIRRPHPFPTDALPCPRRQQRRRHSPVSAVVVHDDYAFLLGPDLDPSALLRKSVQ